MKRTLWTGTPAHVVAFRLVAALAIAASIPAGAVAVFGFDADRGLTADVVALVFTAGIVALLASAWWPGATTRAQRLETMCLMWIVLTCSIHLTWELAWLVFHDWIAKSPDAPLAYFWWMYIDGGDSRYAHASALLLTMEGLSVANGIMGITGIYLYWRRRYAPALLLFMATAVVHLYSTTVYFGTEMLDGYPHVDTSSFVDYAVKFWILNGLWLVVPVFVLVWAYRRLVAGPLSPA